MDILVAALVAALASSEALRFSLVAEQASEASCGWAAVAGLLALACDRALDEASAEALAGGGSGRGGQASLADLERVLESVGVEAAPFRMDPGQLAAAVDSGFVPLIAHYDKPRGHFVLLLHRSASSRGVLLVVADPVRGLETLDEADFLARWSGAVLLADPASLDAAGRGRLGAAITGALARAELLGRGIGARAAIAAAGRASSPGEWRP